MFERVGDMGLRFSVIAVASLAALGTTALSRPASAIDLRMTVQRPHFTCEGHVRHFSDVAYRSGDAGDAPLPCCDGQIGCAQFLSTNTVVRPPREYRG